MKRVNTCVKEIKGVPGKICKNRNEILCALQEKTPFSIEVTELKLNGHVIIAENIQNLSMSLLSNTTLTQLELSKLMDSNNSCIGYKGSKFISTALQFNNTLNVLDLSNNKIGNEGTKEISKSLRINSSLNNLDLSRNGIGKEGAKEISNSLRFNSSLINLNLSDNNIEKEGAKEIAYSLRINSSLNNLALGCKIFPKIF